MNSGKKNVKVAARLFSSFSRLQQGLKFIPVQKLVNAFLSIMAWAL
jgi:hypothetical protein